MSSPSPVGGYVHAAPDVASKWQMRTGWVISILFGLFLAMDGIMKIAKARVYVEGTVKAGYPESVVVPLGVALLISTVFYLVPRTAVLGAILLTGYLGGATATHVRLSQQFWFPIVFGVFVWLGIWLRDRRLRRLAPLTSAS